jgi:hypothetical protein
VAFRPANAVQVISAGFVSPLRILKKPRGHAPRAGDFCLHFVVDFVTRIFHKGASSKSAHEHRSGAGGGPRGDGRQRGGDVALTAAIALVRPRGEALAKAGAHFTKHELTNRAVRRAGQGRAGDSNSGRLGEFAKREAAKTLCGGS